MHSDLSEAVPRQNDLLEAPALYLLQKLWFLAAVSLDSYPSSLAAWLQELLWDREDNTSDKDDEWLGDREEQQNCHDEDEDDRDDEEEEDNDEDVMGTEGNTRRVDCQP